MPDVANRFRPRGPPGQVEFHLRKGQLVKLGTQGAESKHKKIRTRKLNLKFSQLLSADNTNFPTLYTQKKALSKSTELKICSEC